MLVLLRLLAAPVLQLAVAQSVQTATQLIRLSQQIVLAMVSG